MSDFYVVGCPKCGWIRGIEASSKTMSCPRCGQRSNTKGLYRFASVDNRQDIPLAVSAVNEKRRSGEVIEIPGHQPDSKPTNPRRRKRTAQELAATLSEDGTIDFSIDIFLKEAQKEGITKPVDKLDQMMRGGIIIEPCKGMLRWLGN